ncbi:peroxiredoxin [Chytriomyces confervae]|uniref:Peroxiredoxin n=1 Tax=Chytriomyces confervae TaxID=246404 RepID=A0A507FHG6_9FUNG|nr:peroxiredoxin [Chytriomyces confervae]
MWPGKKSSASLGTASAPSTPTSPTKPRFKNKISTIIDVFGSRKRLTDDGSDGELNEPVPPLPSSSFFHVKAKPSTLDRQRPESPAYDTPVLPKAQTARESVLAALSTEETNLRQKIKVVLAGLEEVKETGLDKETLQGVMADLHHLTSSKTIDSEDVALAERILGFYVKPNFEECLALWFGKSKATDDDIWARFGEIVARASNNEMDSWALNINRPRMLVALIILLDQFRRNMYRDTPDMYTRDHHCVKLVKRAIRAEVPAVLQPIEGVFLCLVLTHTENIQDQMLCLEQWTQYSKQLRVQDPLNVFDEIFKRHVAVIQRFGRFPHRNEILGRVSTNEELEFLQDNTFRFDMPLKKDPETGQLVFVPARRHRRVSVLGFEYTTMLPDKGEVDAEYDAAFQFLGPHGIVMKTKEQLTKQGYVRLGDTAPDFSCETSNGPIKFHEYIGDSWVVLFSHPADFTPICTTEFGETAKLKSEWDKRNTKVIGLSVDGLEDHARWIADINEVCNTTVEFPIIADSDRRIAMLFGMLDSTTFRHGERKGETMTVRSVFIISPKKRVELIFSYPAHIGRNFREILRTLDALQLSMKYHVATPVNWMPGDDTVVLPFITDEEAESMFDGDVRKELSYLRWVRDPSTRVLAKEN